jgi:aminopeptidase N
MRTENSVTVFRKDYQPYPYSIPEVELAFDLDPKLTTVTSRLAVQRAPGVAEAPLVLDGSELELVSVTVNGKAWGADRYTLDAATLTLPDLGGQAVIEIVSRCRPEANSTLMGLYVSGGNFFT